ncbi:MAG: phosphate uptake regulator PhoU [Candidatus Bathyarchaeota archaeon]|nr:phosphate uptake regulator PhoU [Candidatus Bathyarchaeota archaeon]
MERKIMSLGKSSMVISLPKDWMEMNNLKKGDMVSFTVQGDRSLVVYPSAQNKSAPREITINIGTNDEEILITQKILGAFLNGYSGMRLITEKVFSVPQIKTIRNITGRLYMRVMESDSKSVYIQSLTDESKASLEQAIQRMHLISKSMCEDSIRALYENDVSLAKSVFSLDDDVDQFAFFILRILREAAQDPILANELHIDPLDCMDHQILVYRMEHAADYAADIAKHLVMLEGYQLKIPEDVLELMVAAGVEVVELYVKAVGTFFAKDIPYSVDIMKHQKIIEGLDVQIASKAFTGKQKSAELVCGICSIRDNIKRLSHCAVNIAEVAVNRAFKEKEDEEEQETA